MGLYLLKKGQVGICVEAFIASKRLPGKRVLGKGDNRTFSSDSDLSARVRTDIILTPQPETKNHYIAWTTTVGISKATIPVTPILDINPDISRQGALNTNTVTNAVTTNGTAEFTLNISATNGFPNLPTAPSEPIDYSIKFTVTPNNDVGLASGGQADGYPSIGIYSYEYVDDKLVTTVIYETTEGTPDDLAPPMEKILPEIKPRKGPQ